MIWGGSQKHKSYIILALSGFGQDSSTSLDNSAVYYQNQEYLPQVPVAISYAQMTSTTPGCSESVPRTVSCCRDLLCVELVVLLFM